MCSRDITSPLFFFFNDTATTEIYTLSLHDALPISISCAARCWRRRACVPCGALRSEEHTSELQSQSNLVCRLLLEKKKQTPKVPAAGRVHLAVLQPARRPFAHRLNCSASIYTILQH